MDSVNVITSNKTPYLPTNNQQRSLTRQKKKKKETVVAELYRQKEIVDTDNDKEKIVCTPKSFLPPPSKIQ